MNKLFLTMMGALVLVGCTPTTTEPVNEQPTPITQEGETPQTGQTIVDVAVANPDFTILVAALQATGLDAALAGEGPFTVFAPDDDAFAKLPAGTLESLLENPDQLAEILSYHVVSGSVTADQVVGIETATTLQGSDLDISVDGDVVMVNDATVTMTDIMASNGVIHVIDTVLLP